MKVQESQCLLNFIEQEISDFLVDKILKNEEIPRTLKNETSLILSFDLELEISKRRNKFVKKTLTIPEYLNVLGMRENLNFSQILAEGLREKLKIK